ncbi:MAG: helix-turn-helix transcriptional regulator [Bacteroidia bacterium]|nr:helix-turn-helix transcriptional regulator [Bacteroidia bacterium]
MRQSRFNIDKVLQDIRGKRKAQKITQQQIANHLGITQSSYKEIELGRTSLKAQTLFDIMDILGVKVDTEGEKEPELPQQINTLEDVTAYMSIFTKCLHNQRDSL